jgi:hypothetical protein
MNCVKCGTQIEEGQTLCAACQALETPTQDLNVPSDPPADAPETPTPEVPTPEVPTPETPVETLTPPVEPTEPSDTPDDNPPMSGIQ